MRSTLFSPVPPVWYETTKKDIDKYDFPLLDCTQEQSGNKTGHRNNTATKWPDKPLWGTRAYREHQRMRYFSSGHALEIIFYLVSKNVPYSFPAKWRLKRNERCLVLDIIIPLDFCVSGHVRLRYITEMRWPRRPGKTPNRDFNRD